MLGFCGACLCVLVIFRAVRVCSSVAWHRSLRRSTYFVIIFSNIYKFYEKAIAEKPKEFSENENRSTGFQKTPSDFPERNNTNITEIKQKYFIATKEKKEN